MANSWKHGKNATHQAYENVKEGYDYFSVTICIARNIIGIYYVRYEWEWNSGKNEEKVYGC